MCEYWGSDVFLHDPLALMTVLNSSFVTFQRAVYHVEHGNNSISRGMCIPLSDHNWQKDTSDSSLEVAVDVRAKEFCEEYIKRIENFEE